MVPSSSKRRPLKTRKTDRHRSLRTRRLTGNAAEIELAALSQKPGAGRSIVPTRDVGAGFLSQGGVTFYAVLSHARARLFHARSLPPKSPAFQPVSLPRLLPDPVILRQILEDLSPDGGVLRKKPPSPRANQCCFSRTRERTWRVTRFFVGNHIGIFLGVDPTLGGFEGCCHCRCSLSYLGRSGVAFCCSAPRACARDYHLEHLGIFQGAKVLKFRVEEVIWHLRKPERFCGFQKSVFEHVGILVRRSTVLPWSLSIGMMSTLVGQFPRPCLAVSFWFDAELFLSATDRCPRVAVCFGGGFDFGLRHCAVS